MSDGLKDLKLRISQLPDEEVLKMVTTDYSDYREDAIEIATQELQRRGFALNQVGEYFNVVTPNAIKLTSPKPNLTLEEPRLFSSYHQLDKSGPGKIPTYAYLLAILMGIEAPILYLLAFVLATSAKGIGLSGLGWLVVLILLTFLVMALSYGALGYIFGRAWPTKSWKWGLWLMPPLVVLTLIGMVPAQQSMWNILSAGRGTLRRSLFFIGVMAGAACLGAFLGARRKIRSAS